jgi:exodeoxyribonuclease V alpha subunit
MVTDSSGAGGRDADDGIARSLAIRSLKSLGFTYTAAVRIHEAYGDDAAEAVKRDPYRIAIEIPGIGFKVADAVAAAVASGGEYAREGFMTGAADEPFDAASGERSLVNFEQRTAAGIRYILSRYAMEGHTCVPRARLIERSTALMDVTSDDVEDSLFSIIMDGRASEALVDGSPRVFLSKYLLAERGVCGDLMRLMSPGPGRLYEDSGDLIARSEASLGIRLSDEQRAAVGASLGSGVFVLTGGPGTGKTTIIRAVIDIFEHAGLRTAVAAPTGRAAKRVTEATGRGASTIHRLLEYYYDERAREMYFGRNANNRLDYDAVIVDEASMIDAVLMHALLAAMESGSRLIIVGDVDQLPPVGAGDVLRDILASGRAPHAILTEIYRQSAESMIVVNAHRIDRGEYPVLDAGGGDGADLGDGVTPGGGAGDGTGRGNGADGSDFIMEERRTTGDALNAILDMYARRLGELMPGVSPSRDVQTLTPMKKGPLGCVNLNRELQSLLNPPDKSKPERKYGERVFRVGDRVMQTRNNYSLEWTDSTDGSEGRGVFNGDMGIVKDIDPGSGAVTVAYDDTRYVTCGSEELMDVEHAYAITVHKSQGSEFPVVIIPVYAAAPMLMTRNLIYTAVTRGRRSVILIGAPERLRQMIDNGSGPSRYSGLKSFLVEFADGAGEFRPSGKPDGAEPFDDMDDAGDGEIV